MISYGYEYYIFVGSFDINPTTGEIKAIGSLDRETKPNYTLDVAATDMDPVTPRRNTSVVLVEVLDTNDNAPVFSQANYVTTMVEHSTPGHTVIQVSTRSQDARSFTVSWTDCKNTKNIVHDAFQ